jgi:hypothetical protein
MSRYTEFDPERLELLSFSDLPHTVCTAQFASTPRPGASFAEFWRSLPAIHAGNSVRTVARRIAQARGKGRAIVAACGAHVVKCGLAPVLIELMREGFITTLAMNGATAIHDAEIALFGATSEVVTPGLVRGSFGMAREISEFFNAAMASALENEEGAGEALGRLLHDQRAQHLEHSLLACAFALGIPVTVHIALGTDIVHMHGGTWGAALGDASMRDFRILTAAMHSLSDGGVLLNIGSAVVLPEVLLKAMACLRNNGDSFSRFLGVNMDMIQHYRANEQVVKRVESIGGEGLSIIGHHEIMIPLLAFAVLEEWNTVSVQAQASHQNSTPALQRNGTPESSNGSVNGSVLSNP